MQLARSIPRVDQGRWFAGAPVAVLYSPLPEFSLGHMTLAVGIGAKDAVVLVADGRVTRPELGSNLIDTDERAKLFAFGRVGVAASGFNGLTERVLERLRDDSGLAAAPNVRVARDIVEGCLQRYMERFHALPDRPGGPQWPRGAFLVAGYEPDGRTPGIYSVHSHMHFSGAEFNWVGSKVGGVAADSFARLLLGGWRARPTRAEAMRFGVMAVDAAHQVDDTVGPPKSIAVITPEGGYEDATDSLDGIVSSLPAAVRRIRDAFGTDH